jgi:hypothetical protein
MPISSSNADLMKKGLRLSTVDTLRSLPRADQFKRGPDEEGIETGSWAASRTRSSFKRGPDEEGIETFLRINTSN